jgi:N-acetylglucosamine kinase-like BadF-type ATPase
VREPLLRWLRKSLPARGHFLLVSDAAIALSTAFGDKPGIVVIAGTGSIAFAQDGTGRVLRSGGWGSMFDDAGSGYDIGRKAVTAALRALDGRGQPTRLASGLCRALQRREITDVIANPPSPPQMAALFPVVLRAARQGDGVARALLLQAAQDLAALAEALIARLGWKRKDFQVALTGGIFHSSSLIRAEFERRIVRLAPRARVSVLRRLPVEGALALARELGAATLS